MAKPNYASLLAQIAVEADADTKQALIDQCYVFTEALTEEEEDLFSYVARDYFEDNPGDDAQGNFVSYVGVYFSETGERTDV
jgi:hypothetical protein